MRVTNSTVLRNYDRNLKRLGKNKFGSEQKIFTGRSFSRASEDPLGAAKALTVRKQLSRAKQHMENLDVADKFYTEAETSMLQISDQLATIRETLIAAVKTTNEQMDLDIYAQQLETRAEEMCAVFNTDTAERVIFGGESNNPEPFRLNYDENGIPTEVLYHGVPINAYTNSKDFPYSNDVYIDIGLGMVVDQDTQALDAQTALKVSFNGAALTGCGSSENKASIDAEQLVDGSSYTLNIFVDGDSTAVTFTAGADTATSIANLNTAIEQAYLTKKVKPTVDADGNITAGDDVDVYIQSNANSENQVAVTNDYEFSKNYVQLTLDAAKALRDGDLEYANACIDRIVNASENLLVEIASLGNAEEFIEFNQSRFETRELNLKDRQDTLEATDLESEITLYKTYEALYNACLQMSSAVIPNSIFNYIR